MIIIYNQELEEQSINSLINEIDNAEEFVDLYITTPGGSKNCYEPLIDYLNSKKELITLIANWEISSGGFLLFFKFQGEKKILPGTTAMVHLTTSSLDAREFLQQRSRTISVWKKLQEVWEAEIEYYRMLGIRTDKLNLISTGHDIYLGYSELSEILEREVKKNENIDC